MLTLLTLHDCGTYRSCTALLGALAVGWSCTAQTPLPPEPDLELVESVPVETILDDPDLRNTAGVWTELINAAGHTLDIEQFYIAHKAGDALESVLRAIDSAAIRGVRVRIIVDSRMYRTYPETADRLAEAENISVRIIDFGKLAGGIQHSKFFIIDGRTVFVGSQNFDWRALTHIRELGMRIRHEQTARAFGRLFETDWALAGGAPVDSIMTAPGGEVRGTPFPIVIGERDTAQLTPTWSPPGLIPDTTLWDEREIVRLLDGARREVMCQFLSYSTEGRDRSSYRILDDALRRAASRGVPVRMIVSDWEKGTHAEQSLKNLAAVSGLQVRFSVIPEWSGGYLSFARVEHCKYILVDGERFWLGTSNAEKSYFHTSRNVGVVVASRTLGARLSRFFMKGWDGPYLEPVISDGTYRARRHDGE